MNGNSGHLSQQTNWSTGIFDCGDDCGTYCITWLFPCITFGKVAEMLEEEENACVPRCLVYGVLYMVYCQWLYSCIYRKKLRRKFALPEEPCADCCVHFWCGYCAIIQEHSELKSRGFDPSKGWIGPPSAPPKVPTTMHK